MDMNMDINSRSSFFRYNMGGARALALWLVVTVIVCVAICGCGGHADGPVVTDAPSALKVHRAFLRKVSRSKGTDMKSLVGLTREWFVLSDTLVRHIQPDSVSRKIYDGRVFDVLQDSIVGRLEGMVDAEVRSFEDVLVMREVLGREPGDSTLWAVGSEAQKFFETLDMVEVPEMSKEEALDSYTGLLKSYLERGVSSKADMLRFIRAEDMAFRGFLVHLHELGNTSLKSITNATERVCDMVFRSAYDGRMGAEMPLAYMVMRTNRRLIQNAMACLGDIRAGRVTGNSEQAVVYLWMMMKPFFPTDEVSVALLYDRQRGDMRTLARELPAVAASLNRGMGWAPLPIEEMPNEIIKDILNRR